MKLQKVKILDPDFNGCYGEVEYISVNEGYPVAKVTSGEDVLGFFFLDEIEVIYE